MKKYLFWTWELPQTAVGYFMCGLLELGGHKLTEENLADGTSVFLRADHKPWAISLGGYIIVNARTNELTHEYGHQKQSRMLGPLYLIVIGLPSLFWATLKSIGLFKNKSYYWFYTEKWADKLMNIER